MNIRTEPHDRLVRRHEQTEVSLEGLARDEADAPRETYQKLAEKEERYRVERVIRAFNRERGDAGATATQTKVAQ